MANKFPEAERRMFKDVFVCRRCKSIKRTTYQQIKLNKTKCRKCQSRAFRPKNKQGKK